MDQIVFVRTRWHYASYRDYWRMVEVSGFPTCFVDEVDVEANRVYVVCPLNGEWRPMLEARMREGKKRRATLVSWTLEPPVKDDYLLNLRRTVDEGLVDWIWIAYRNMAEQAAHSRILFMPFGSHEAFGQPPDGEIRFDIVMLAYASHRRALLVDRLEKKGVKVMLDGYFDIKWAALRTSRFMLNVHKDHGHQVYEPIRFAVGAAYGLPIISESCVCSDPYVAMADYYETSYDGVVGTVVGAWARTTGRGRSWGSARKPR